MHMNPETPITRSQLDQLGEYDTALLANLLGFVDPIPTHEYYMANSIRALAPELGPTVGIAVTCELDSSTPDHLAKGDIEGYWTQLAQMEAMEMPTVWGVHCVGSRPEHECVLGDGMAKTLHSVGCVGVVTDGGVRDLSGLRSTPFAAYGTGTTVHHCKMRLRALNERVEIGGITVAAGEIIHASAEGVIKIPARAVGLLLQQAPSYRAFEHEAHQMLRRTDLTVAEKRERMGGILGKYSFKDCVTR
jgi:4-hydroxy-4-methyl-2-oxoglutarate aldolase